MNRKTFRWIETILQLAIIALCFIDGWALTERISAASFYDVSSHSMENILICAIVVILTVWKIFPIKIPYILPLGFQTFVCIGLIKNTVMRLAHNGRMLPVGYIHLALIFCALIVGIILPFFPSEYAVQKPYQPKKGE